MAKKKSSRPKSSRPSVPRDALPGPEDQVASICAALGITEEELLERFEGMMGGDVEPPRAPRRTRRIDPTANEWEAFDIVMNADLDNPRTMMRDLKRAQKLDPRCAMIPATMALNAASQEESLDLHRDTLSLLGDRIHAGNIRDLCGDADPLDHPYGAPFISAHRNLAQHEMSRHHYSKAIPHLEAILASEYLLHDNDVTRGFLALCHMHHRNDPAARVCLGAGVEPDQVDVFGCMIRALLEFRESGDSMPSNHWIDLAENQNPYIAKMFLQGHDDPEFDDAEYREEADAYWAFALPVWRETEGTMAWIRQRLMQSNNERKLSLSERKELAEQLVEELGEIPLCDDTWRIVVREVEGGRKDTSGNLIVAYVTTVDGQELLHTSVLTDRPKTEDLLQMLVEACEAHELLARPLEVLFEDKRLVRLAERGLGMCGMKARLTDPLPKLDLLIDEHLANLREVTEGSNDSLADVEGLFGIEGTWSAGFGRLHAWIEVEGRLIRPWLGIVVSPEGVHRFLQTIHPTITEADWVALLCSAMCHPMVGEPGVPLQLVFRNARQQREAREVWHSLDIKTSVIDRDEPDAVMNCIVEFSKRMEPDTQFHHALSSIEGLTHEELEAFYAAACVFHQAAPWRHCGEHTSLVLQGGDWPAGRVMCAMGEAGLTQGLAVYATQREFEKARTGGKARSLVVLFDEPQLAAFSDLDRIEDHHWPLSSEQAYPVAFQSEGPLSLECPTRSDIQMLTAALSMIPQVIQNPLQPVVQTNAQGRTLTMVAQTDIVFLPGSPAPSPKKGRKKR